MNKAYVIILICICLVGIIETSYLDKNDTATITFYDDEINESDIYDFYSRIISLHDYHTIKNQYFCINVRKNKFNEYESRYISKFISCFSVTNDFHIQDKN